MDDERCEFGEPVVANDLVAVSDKLAGPLRVQRLKMKVAFWLLIPAIALPLLAMELMGVSLTVTGWKGVALFLVAPWPIIAILLWQIFGEKRVRRKIYREEGLYCLSCGKMPSGSGADQYEDWIAWRSCPRCEGKLKRFENDRTSLPRT